LFLASPGVQTFTGKPDNGIPFGEFLVSRAAGAAQPSAAPQNPAGFGVRDAASIGVGILPITGIAQSGIELATGYDYIANRPASRVFAAVGIAAALIPGGKPALNGLPRALGAAARSADEVVDGARVAGRVDNMAGAGKNIAGLANTDPSTIVPRFSAWTRVEVNGTRVYQRSDLINPSLTDKLGRTNLQRMQQGLAPLGPDGKSINLHHMLQTADGPLAEVTQTFHQTYSKTIHINPITIPSGIDRPAFDVWRSNYWMNRANRFLPRQIP
jgi:hypothetical protein